MNKRLLPLGLAAGLLVAGCSTISSTFDSLNPFASSARKMSPLPELTAPPLRVV